MSKSQKFLDKLLAIALPSWILGLGLAGFVHSEHDANFAENPTNLYTTYAACAAYAVVRLDILLLP